MKGSLNNNSYCTGLVLNSLKPKRLKIDYALRLKFKASNNAVKYKAPLFILLLVQMVEAKHFNIFNNS